MSITKKLFVGAFVAAFALVAAKANAAYVHTMTLKQGSTGAQVMALQQTLNANGFLVSSTGAGSPGMESTYFGSKTKAAVMAFQAAKGLSPVDGIVGPVTGTALAALTGGTTTGGNLPAGCSSTSGFSTVNGQPCNSGSSSVPGCLPGYMYSPTTGQSCSGGSTSTGNLQGGAGALNDVDLIGSVNNEEVGEGENDVQVVGLDVEADQGSDLALTSVRVDFEQLDSDGSNDLDDYADEVTVWLGDKQVGSANVDDFSESSNVWTKSINLSNAVIGRGDTEKLYVAVSALNNIDSSDLGSSNNDWVATVASIRFRDAQGAFITDDSTGDLPAARHFDFVSFSTSADTELRISKTSDSPDAGIVVVDNNDGEDDVVLLAGQLRLTGESDVNIDQFPVTITVGGGDMLNEIVSDLTLVIDGTSYEADSIATTTDTTTATIVFDDLDFDLSAGDTVDFEVRANVLGTDDHGEGDTLTASVTSDNRSAIDAENEEGDQVDDSDKTGTATGSAQEFRSEGISVTLLDKTSKSTSTNSTTNATYTIKFKVTAIGDDVYIGTTVGEYGFVVEDNSGTSTTAGVTKTIAISDAGVNSTSTSAYAAGWKINEGTSVTITLTAFAQSSGIAAGAYRADLESINWDTDATDATLDNTYTSDLENFHTDYELLD